MTDKQIIIDYKNLCENYSKEVGCYNTFDGSCIKEQCFTYRLLQLLKAKEQECELLVNKNNILSEKLDTTQLLLEGKNNQYAAKMQVCDELHSIIQNRNEEIKNLNYVLYEERELTLDLGKANLKIASLERNISSHKNRFKYEIDKLKKELSSLLAEKNAIEIGRYEYKQECEELKKQLERKEENYQKFLSKSNKYIHNSVDENVQDISNLAIQLDQLKAENDELKKTIMYKCPQCSEEYLNPIGASLYDENNKLKAENEKLKAEKVKYYQQTLDDEIQINELLQTLTEIKEIAKKACCLQPTSSCEEYENCKECSRTSDDVTVKQILQKINECEVKNERKENCN